MPEHPSIEDLADAAEELLDPARNRALAAHLAACPPCQRRAAALEQVRTTLAAEPSPAMPPAVAARLSDTLREESRWRGSATGPAPLAAPRPDRPPGAYALDPGHHLHQRPAHQGHGHATLGDVGAHRGPRPRWRRWAPALAAAVVASAVGFAGYVLSATAGLNDPPVLAAAVSTRDLAAQASTLEQRQDLDPHRFSSAWFCARSVTRGRITGLAGAQVDGRPALLVYSRSDDTTTVTVVTGCNGVQPTAIASAALPR